MKFILPMPTSVNSAYKNIRGRGRAKTDAVKAWEQEAKLSLVQQRLVRGGARVPPPPYRLSLGLYFKDERRNDIANREKVLVDFLVGQEIIEDDSNIDELIIRRIGIDKSNPRVEIEITSIIKDL